MLTEATIACLLTDAAVGFMAYETSPPFVFIVVGASQPLPSFQGLPFAISIRVIKDRKEEIYEKEGNRTQT